MHTLAFWKRWPKAEQVFLIVPGVIFLIAIASSWYSYTQNPAPAITWKHYEEIQTEEVTLRTFPVGLFDMPVKADNFFVFETQSGSELNVATTWAYVNLALFMFSACILLAIITTLKRFWFLAGMTIFSLFCVSLNLETTRMLEHTNRYPTFVILFALIALCYYFHAFGAHISFFKRLISILVVFALAGTGIAFLAQAPVPFLHLSANTYTAGVALTIVFILMIGHEIPALFVNLITRGNRQSKSLQHFSVISAFYVLNLLLAYAKEIGYLTWNIWTINGYLLLTASAILGIWGFIQRSHQYENILGSEALAAYLVLALGIIAFSTLTTLMVSANDNAVDVLHDIILYSHLGFGIIFLFYVIANFGPMLMQNLQVYKVLYKPNIMHFVTFRIMGFITCIAFMFFDTSYGTLVDQLYSSYYNAQGDVYYHTGIDQAAESYYNKSVLYRNQNHHAHYALASIQQNRLELRARKAELASICFSSPSEYAYVNLSDAFHETGEPYEALFLLNQAKKKFPESGVINNALGIAFSRLKVADSALLSFQAARKDKAFKSAAETNLLAASAKFKVSYPADSLLQLVGATKEGAMANALALANTQNIPINKEFVAGNDTTWTPTRVTYLCNYLVNQASSADTALIRNIIEVARKPVNEYYTEAVIVAAAQALYAQGKVKAAFDLTREMAFGSGRGRYYALLGYWALEQNNPVIAASYFEIAKEKRIPRAMLYQALALTEADSVLPAKPLWDSLTRVSDKPDSTFARTMIKVLNASISSVTSLSNTEKYWFCRYRLTVTDSIQLYSVIKSITDSDLQSKAWLDAAKKWYQADELEVAATCLNKINTPPADAYTNNELLIYKLLLLAQLDSDTFRQQKLVFDPHVVNTFPNEVILLKTWQAELNGHAEQIRSNYGHLGHASIHFEDGLVAAAQFFASDTTDRLKPYSILVSGLIARPNSIKLLKAHTLYTAQIGFDDEATQSLEKLRGLLSPRAFNRFVSENSDIFTIQD
ncbi:MAG: hypothetical protein KIT62_03055 [Cyclobacteriaceae bacterium]|nr:hypothetical protein [Cyclobacteriaceae bacterium]